MRRLFLLLSFLVLSALACTLQFQTMPETEIPVASAVPATQVGAPGGPQIVDGPNIDYNGIHFNLAPFATRVYVYNDEITIDGKTAHSVRFSLNPDEQYCQAWCLTIYPVAEFQQAFGNFVFPPEGYRGGAAIIFHAQEKLIHFQQGTGTRALEAFGQNNYGVSNESLKYVFRGYNEGKQYGVYLQEAIRVESLPDTAPTPTTGGDPTQDILQYNQQVTQSINALASKDFTPSLDSMDALVASIWIGKP